MRFVGNVFFCIVGFFVYQWLFADDIDAGLTTIFVFLFVILCRQDIDIAAIDRKLDEIKKGKR